MRMYFDSDKAFAFLKENQHVFTLRKQKQSEKPLSRVEIWRLGKPANLAGFKVRVDNLPECELHYLGQEIIQNSGFASLEEWKQEAIRLSGHQDVWSIFYVHVSDV